ncbi:transcriptional regulator [Fulvitalea axinellae]|uniref:Transcriptional regulator n=1 Tax=Fulvitalea axinellae TaxID=1182444 RepID=A0AAU9D442_9BACT|nr:transcriptional regulator [Fulvitalea axinellae]
MIRVKNEGKVSQKRRIRKNIILKALKNHGTLSLSAISKQTELTVTMVSELIKELEADKLVKLIELTDLKVGRPPTAYALNPEGAYFLGLHLSKGFTNVVVLNFSQDVLYRDQIEPVNLKDSSVTLEQMKNYIHEACAQSGISTSDLTGIGVALPGLVDSSTGTSYTHLTDSDFRGELESIVGVPVFLDNDVNAMTYGEMEFGEAKDVGNAAYMNIGWGIGMGIILDGKLYRGSTGFSGEFGHIYVDEEGALCDCGKNGCLEAVASGKAMTEGCKKLLAEGESSVLMKMADGDPQKVTLEMVIEAARGGDAFALREIQRAGTYIGKALSSFINLFNPELIVLGGMMSNAQELLLYPVRLAVMQFSLKELHEGCKIKCSKLGYWAGPLGATTMVSRLLFEVDHLHVDRYV